MVSHNQRIYGLDILRAAAILAVLYSHAYYKIATPIDETIYRAILPDGVSLFFVLSGFLIGSILIRTINETDFDLGDLKDFWIKRWFRTLPAYFFILSFLMAQHLITDAGSEPFLFYFKYYIFLQSVGDGFCYLYAESWSLCVEEWFYLLIPVFLFLLLRLTPLQKRKAILFTIVATIVVITLLRVYKVKMYDYSTIKEWDNYLRKPLMTRLDSIMYGFVGAYAMFYHAWVKRYKNTLFAIGVLLFLTLGVRALFGFGTFYNYLQLPAESIATLFLIPRLLEVKNGRGWIFRIITFISMISYSIYLINYTPYDLWIEPWLKKYFDFLVTEPTIFADIIRVSLFLCWSLGGAYLLYRFVEKPMMKKRDLFTKNVNRRSPKPVIDLEMSK